jgi:hypothetical protein
VSIGILESLRDFRQVASPLLKINQSMFDWKKPGNVRSSACVTGGYLVYMASKQNFADAEVIATTGKTSFICTPLRNRFQP